MPAAPSSEAMRPQYGSAPYHEHLHSWLSATCRAPAAASAALVVPVTSTRTTLVAPSASPAIWAARLKHASPRAAVSSPSPAGPARPEASTITVSLVDVQPSTLSTL